MWKSFACTEFAPRVVDEENRKVVLFVEGKGESDMGTYLNEYVVVLGCDADVSILLSFCRDERRDYEGGN
jgi:hypothetical protein